MAGVEEAVSAITVEVAALGVKVLAGVAEGVNARTVAVAALGVAVLVPVGVEVGNVPVMVTVGEAVNVGTKVAVGGALVKVGCPGRRVLVGVGVLVIVAVAVAVKVDVSVGEGVSARTVCVAALGVFDGV